VAYEPSPDLEDALGDLKDADVPDTLADEVIGAVRTQKRWLGLHPREWALVSVAFALFVLGLQTLITWGMNRFFGE
jgi:hypothetical protein